jgi:hypothetical protein
MADFTEPLNPATPADTDFVSEGDDAIRQLKRSVLERAATLVRDVESNPWMISSSAIDADSLPDGIIGLDKLDPNALIRSIIRAVVSISGTVNAGVIGGGPQTVTGAEPGDTVLLSWATGDGRFCLNGAVTAVDEVTVAYTNITAGAITLSSAPLLITVIKPGVPGVLQTDTVRILPFTLFQPSNITDPVVYTATELALGALTAVTVRAGTALPTGRQILSASIKVRSTGLATVSATFVKISSGGVSTTLASFAPAAGSGDQIVIQNVTYTVASGDMFYFVVVLSSLTSPGDEAALSWAKIVLV